MNIGIVGHEAAKFTPKGEIEAKHIIAGLLDNGSDVLVSGGCHLGGIDIWAEEKAAFNGMKAIICLPRVRSWEKGYKPRNIQIAEESDIVHCLVVDKLPSDFQGMRFEYCYHCDSNEHVKSGGCWTMHHAASLGKPVQLHVIHNF